MIPNPLPDPSSPESGEDVQSADEGALGARKNAFSEHKGKLAIGVAATLGLMVYYKWRERQLAKDDPEDYARLQRLKAGVKTSEPDAISDDTEFESNRAASKIQNEKDRG